jgi:hypothetical protein
MIQIHNLDDKIIDVPDRQSRLIFGGKSSTLGSRVGFKYELARGNNSNPNRLNLNQINLSLEPLDRRGINIDRLNSVEVTVPINASTSWVVSRPYNNNVNLGLSIKF